MNVLVIDDDPVGCNILGETIATAGFSARCVNDGLQAMNAVENGFFPLIVCDWEMPGVDGPSFCRWLRASDVSRCTYIVMLTARGGIRHTAEGISSGADTFLTKPCAPVAIIDHLRLGARLLGPREPLPVSAWPRR